MEYRAKGPVIVAVFGWYTLRALSPVISSPVELVLAASDRLDHRDLSAGPELILLLPVREEATAYSVLLLKATKGPFGQMGLLAAFDKAVFSALKKSPIGDNPGRTASRPLNVATIPGSNQAGSCSGRPERQPQRRQPTSVILLPCLLICLPGF